MSDVKRRIRVLEQKRAKRNKGWRCVYLCTVDGSWCVSDKNGIHEGVGEPYPEILPGDVVFRTNIPASCF